MSEWLPIAWIIGGILLLAGIVVLFVALRRIREGKTQEPDYYAYFILGITWVPLGVLMMAFLLATGNSKLLPLTFSLIGMGLVYKFDFGDGRARYELTQGPNVVHHHHLVCTRCGRIIDYTEFIDREVEVLKDIEKGLSEKYDFEIMGHMIRFVGLCSKCKTKT